MITHLHCKSPSSNLDKVRVWVTSLMTMVEGHEMQLIEAAGRGLAATPLRNAVVVSAIQMDLENIAVTILLRVERGLWGEGGS